jgi:hypothetical protein
MRRPSAPWPMMRSGSGSLVGHAERSDSAVAASAKSAPFSPTASVMGTVRAPGHDDAGGLSTEEAAGLFEPLGAGNEHELAPRCAR